MAGALHSAGRVFDVVIIGGGPAGLSAALVLGRCRRNVLLCDEGSPRNARSSALHAYLTRDGTPPLDLLRIGREELKVYGIQPCRVRVTDLVCISQAFEATLDDGRKVMAETALIATGVRDHVPDIPGIDECYGVTVHHCPYCDGWEERDKAIAVIGQGMAATGLALSLKTWSSSVFLCTNGLSRMRPADGEMLAREHIPVHTGRIVRVDHEGTTVRAIVFRDDSSMSCDAIFFSAGQSMQSDLAKRIGCEMNRRGTVKTSNLGGTAIPGLFVVGDASHDVQFAIVAAAEGAKAGVAINKALQARAGRTIK